MLAKLANFDSILLKFARSHDHAGAGVFMKPDQDLSGSSLPGSHYVRRPIDSRPWLAVLLFIICAAAATDSAASSAKNLGEVLTGKFVARVDGPRLSGFGLNHELYVFEIDSATGSQFVTLFDTFLIYQPHVPIWALDYSKVYQLAAVRDNKCDDTLENLARRSIFDSHGQFIETRNSVTYAKNSPVLVLPWASSLPCYVVSPVQPPAKTLTEVNSPAPPQ
jgi:hypothetical protein